MTKTYSKDNYPTGVEVSNTKCKGPLRLRTKKDDGDCPSGNYLKVKTVKAGGSRCFGCVCKDDSNMNKNAGHGGNYQGGVRQPGSKGSPRKKGSGKQSKVMSVHN